MHLTDIRILQILSNRLLYLQSKWSNPTFTNYFTIFLQTIDMINSYEFLYGLITNIIFLLTSKYLEIVKVTSVIYNNVIK